MENSNNNCNNNIYISCAKTASVVKVNGDKSRYYAELAEQFKNEAKGYKDTAQYYAEQNSDVTLEDITTLDTTLRNLINNKQDTGDYALVSNLPTKISDLTNDSGYITTSSVGDGTITIKQDEVTIGSFTTNQSGNTAINIDLSGKANVTRLHSLKCYEDVGELLTDAEGLADVMTYAHSTFDLSKFNVVGSPTITDDGIASGFSTNNYLLGNNFSFNITNTNSWEIEGDFTTGSNISTAQYPFSLYDIDGAYGIGINVRDDFCFLSVSDSNGVILDASQYADINANTRYKYKITYDSVTGYKFYLATYGSPLQQVASSSDTRKMNYGSTGIRIGRTGDYSPRPFLGSIDLKQFLITVDNIPVFSGNKTGIDTYTINGNTVTIPYTVSKTGSKIVDSACRTQVASVYSAFGSAPYYTLSDSDFTLPQGELYGMLQSYSDGEIVYTNQTIIENTSLSGSTNLSKTVALPDDGYTYLVYFRGSCTTDAINQHKLHLTLFSSAIGSGLYTYCASSWAVGNFATTHFGSCVLPMKAGTGNLELYRSETMNGTATLTAVWYRRMGKNK